MVNPHILKQIVNSKKNNSYEVDSMIRYKAKCRYELAAEEAYEDNRLMIYNTKIEIEMLDDFNKVKHFDFNRGTFHFCFNGKWLRENTDMKSILGILIYVFEFVDSKMRSTICNVKEDSVLLNAMFNSNSSKEFTDGFTYRNSNT